MRSLALIALMCMLVGTVNAQELGGAEPLTILITPEHPRPYDTVIVSPRSTQFNLTGSSVTISANGTVVEEGSGGKSVAVRLGGPGSRTTIRVVAVNGAASYTKEQVIVPADVALVLEPITSTHPFYDGGSLVAPEGRVRIVAVPDLRTSAGARIAPQNLTYTWRLANRILTEESGIGRSVLVATAPIRYRDADVSVTVTNSDESVVGYARVTVAPASPVVYAYRSDPLLGVDFSTAITDAFTMMGEEESFRAIGYHFARTPAFSWTLNGDEAGTSQDLTVRTTSTTSGNARVELNAEDVAAGQGARASFTVNFGARRSGNIFGF